MHVNYLTVSLISLSLPFLFFNISASPLLCFPPQALDRLLLCTNLPSYVQRSVGARLQHWHARVGMTAARRRPHVGDSGGDVVAITTALLDRFNTTIQLARDGWHAPHVVEALTQGTLARSMAGQVRSLGQAHPCF